MRIEVELYNDSPFKFPRDYRNYFISFLKKVFSKAGLFQELYEGKRTKPFTFSVWLGDKFEIEDDEIQLGDRLYFLFSSGEPSILAYFYNGIINIKEETIPLGKSDLRIGKISLQPLKKIKGRKILCKTMGISILTNPDESARDFKKWYVTPTDDLTLFNNILKRRTNERFERIKGRKGKFEIELKPLMGYKDSINETVVKHYGAYLKGFRGSFWLEGDEEILQFVYDFGLGVRTGQGFGMIEVIKETE